MTKGRSKPLYEQIKEKIRARILSGELKANELAPSEAEIIRTYRVSSITARRCLNDLENEGFVRRVKGRGTYVRTLDALAAERHIGLFYHELISLSGGYLSKIFAGIFEELRQSRMEPDLLSWAPVRRSPAPAEALVDLIRQRNVDASILLSPAPAGWLDQVVATGHPVVSISFSYENPAIYSLLFDNSGIVGERNRRLHALGHRRIAVFHEYFDEPAPGVLYQPRRWDEEAFYVRYIEIPYLHYDRVRLTIEEMVHAADAPTLYFVHGYELALHVRQALDHFGVGLPAQASMIVAGQAPGPTRFEMEEVPAVEVGRRAVEVISGAIQGQPPAPRVERFPVRARAGQTLGPAPGSGSGLG